MERKILEVSEVELIAEYKQRILSIVAHGTVTTSGWRNPRLIPYVYITPPADGIYDFDFVADAPDGQALQVLLPISAKEEWQDFPSDLKGVRIHASTNSVEKKLDEAKAAKVLVAEDYN